jgi:hypothetical protein
MHHGDTLAMKVCFTRELATGRRPIGSLSTAFHNYGNAFFSQCTPLTHRFAVPPLPEGEGCLSDDLAPSPRGEAGAKRRVRGLLDSSANL